MSGHTKHSITLAHCEHAEESAKADAVRALDDLTRSIATASIDCMAGTNSIRREVAHAVDALAALDRARAVAQIVRSLG